MVIKKQKKESSIKLKYYQDLCKCGNVKDKRAKRCRECFKKKKGRTLSRNESGRKRMKVIREKQK